MPEKVYDKIIIGGGAAGIMAAYSACTANRQGSAPKVLILEANDKAGKKLTATGNGKCNFTNLFQEKDCYRSSDSEKAYRIINKFDNVKTIDLFKNIGIPYRERNGYCYPYGEQARTFRDIFVNTVRSLGVTILTEKKVKDIVRKDGKYSVTCEDGSSYVSEKLIISCGGAAAPSFGSDGSIFKLLKKMGLDILKPEPALCGLKLDHKALKRIDGVRVKCNCSLFSEKEKAPVYEESGEVIFNKKGISGIPVMNLSRFAVNLLKTGEKPELQLDLFPDTEISELKEYISSLLQKSGLTLGVSLSAFVNDKLVGVLIEEAGLDPKRCPKDYDPAMIRKAPGVLASKFKQIKMNITDSNGFENAQTTQGGVLLKEIDEKNMECIKYPGMYLAGEVLDVDGMCGGYNLQWAWSTGYIAGRG